jgi:glycosyltransferase involved in cell wall biosynthesis
MSIALLEAMALGLPAVITFGGPEEAVIDGRNGFCPPPANPPALAAALWRLVSDESLRQSLGRAAADDVRDHFSISRVADDLLQVYAAARGGPLPEHLRADRQPTNQQLGPNVAPNQAGRTLQGATNE